MEGMDSLWSDLATMQITPIDKVIRTVAVYLALLLLIRFLGRRIMAQMNSLDLVVVLLLSNVVQNAIIGPDNSLLGGLLGAVVLVLANEVLDRLTGRFRWLQLLFEGPTTTLITDGQLDQKAARSMGLDLDDISVALRHQGASRVADVANASLNDDGAMVVDLKDGAMPVSRADLDAALDRLRAELVTELKNR